MLTQTFPAAPTHPLPPQDPAVVLLIFDAPWDGEVTLDCPETRRTPDQTWHEVVRHIQENDTAVIRTYSEIPVNLLGLMIHRGAIAMDKVIVRRPDGQDCYYDKLGILQNWQYGLFTPSDTAIGDE